MSKKNENDKQFSRRDFLKTTGAFTGGVVGGSLLGGTVTGLFRDDSINKNKTEDSKDSSNQSSKDRRNARMVFDRIVDYKTLEAATELIFPEDDIGPGAIALGVPIFIDKQLAMIWGVNGNEYRSGPFPEEHDFQGLDKVIHSSNTRQSIFIEGIRKLSDESKKRFDKPFYEINENEQTEIMDDFVEGNIEMSSVESDGFFALLKQSVLEGAYSDPLYGGNKDMEGWKMKNYPGPKMSYVNWIDSEEFVQDEIEPASLIDYQQG